MRAGSKSRAQHALAGRGFLDFGDDRRACAQQSAARKSRRVGAAHFGLALPLVHRERRRGELFAFLGDNTGQDVWNRVDQGCFFMVSDRLRVDLETADAGGKSELTIVGKENDFAGMVGPEQRRREMDRIERFDQRRKRSAGAVEDDPVHRDQGQDGSDFLRVHSRKYGQLVLRRPASHAQVDPGSETIRR